MALIVENGILMGVKSVEFARAHHKFVFDEVGSSVPNLFLGSKYIELNRGDLSTYDWDYLATLGIPLTGRGPVYDYGIGNLSALLNQAFIGVYKSNTSLIYGCSKDDYIEVKIFCFRIGNTINGYKVRHVGSAGTGSDSLATTSIFKSAISTYGSNDANVVGVKTTPVPDITVFRGAGTAAADEIVDNGTVLSLGAAQPGASGATQTITIANADIGSGFQKSLSELAVSVDGANAGDFTVGAPGATTLQPGGLITPIPSFPTSPTYTAPGSTTFTVTFSPGTGAAAGLKQAVVRIASNDPDEPSFRIPVTGRIGAAPSVTVSTATPGMTTVDVTGNVTADGGATVTERGVVISESCVNTSPRIGGLGVTTASTTGGTGSFPLTATGLTNVTGYSFKAYATNGVGTTYTSVGTFTTGAAISANADLSALALTTATINEAFAANTTIYTSSVPNATSSVTVTPTAAQANATIEARVASNAFATVTSGSPSASLALAVGANTIDVKVTAQDGTTIQTYTITVTRRSIIEDWRQSFFGTSANTGNAANTADGDGDTLSNLLEFAFGTNPTINNSSALVYTGTFAGGGTITATGQPITRFESVPNGIDFRAVFVRRKDFAAAGLKYRPQFSVDMSSWQPTSDVEPTVAVLADDGTYQIVSVPYPAFISGKKAKFFRISVSIAP